MELLWASVAPQSVADVHHQLNQERELAYTTVMTVLDRLAKKGLVSRELVARAWQYRPTAPQADVVARDLERLLAPVAPDVRLDALRRLSEGLSSEERAALAAPLATA